MSCVLSVQWLAEPDGTAHRADAGLGRPEPLSFADVSGEKRHMLTLGTVEAISAVTARETLARGLHSFGLIK